MKTETIAVHAGGDPDPATSAIAPPTHLSTPASHPETLRVPFREPDSHILLLSYLLVCDKLRPELVDAPRRTQL